MGNFEEMLTFERKRAVAFSSICASSLIFQVFSTRLLSVVIAEQLILFAVSFALLGMGVAASAVSLRKAEFSVSDRTLSLISAGLVLSYAGAIYLCSVTGEIENTKVSQIVALGGGERLFEYLRSTMFNKMVVFGAILFLPYLAFGLLAALFFKSCESTDYHKYYAADLIGAACGAVLAMIVLDAFGFRGGLALTLGTGAAGAFLFAWRNAPRLAAVTGTMLVLALVSSITPPIARIFEPRASLELLSRDFNGDREAKVNWTRWNAHSRIAQVDLRNKDGRKSEIYAHEGGDGWANIRTDQTPLVYTLAGVLDPEEILVLFAGVGADMQALEAACDGTCSVIGVEINRQMVEHAKETYPAVASFLKKPNVSLNVAEAREFLERDPKHYDSILLSWWGAGQSHYIGTSGQLSEYLYTRQAFDALLDHLKPSGTITIYNGSKAQILATLATVFNDRGVENLANRVILLRPKDLIASKSAGFYDTPESMRLILKPDGFTHEDVEKLEAFATKADMAIVLGPEGALPGYEIYDDLVSGKDISAVNASLREKYDLEVSVPDDSRPFVNDLTPRSEYFDLVRLASGDVDSSSSWRSIRIIFLFNVLLAFISAILILGPVAIQAGPARSRSSAYYLAYFACIGAGFMLIEVGLLRKFGLLLGHPSYAISIVLASLILSTGIGSLLSPKLETAGFTSRRTALFVYAYSALIILLYPHAFHWLIALPFAAKAVVTIAFIMPLGVALGQFFPRGLVAAGAIDKRMVPWAWAVNGTMSTIGAGFALYLSYPLGFDWIILIGGSAYLIIALVHDRATKSSRGNSRYTLARLPVLRKMLTN